MAITTAQRKLYSSNPVDEVALDTLEISHSGFDQTYYFVNRDEALITKLEDGSDVTFQPFGFALQLPEAGSAQQDVAMTLDGVSGLLMRQLWQAIEVNTEPVVVKYRMYIDKYLDGPQTNPPLRLEMTNIEATLNTVSGTVSRPDLVRRTFPRRIFRPSEFPGLQRG